MASAIDVSEVNAIADRFVAARRSATALAAYPGPVPDDLAAAYAIQDAAIARYGGAVAGWKSGRINPPDDARYGTDRLAGPIFRDRVRVAGPSPVAVGVFAGGFGAVEGEFLYRLGRVDPAKRGYSLAEAADVVAAVHVGIEVASSPLASINALGPAVTASDFGNNNGLVIGAEVPDWRAEGIDGWVVTTEIDGIVVGSGRGAAFGEGTLGSVRFLLELLAARGIAVAEGSWISSGAVTGVHPIAPGQGATVRFGDRHGVAISVAAEAPSA